MSIPAPTIYDVAKTAQVSIATVSRVLNSPEKVSPETRILVLEAIEQLGFVPKADARARAMKDNRRVGVITPFLTAPSFVQRLRGVATGLRQSHFELVVYSIDSGEVLNRYLENLPVAQYLDGLIILSLQVPVEKADWLVRNHLDTVLVEYPTPVLNSIEISDEEGGRLAASYLTAKGHRRLGFVGDTTVPEFGIHPITLRLRGFRHELNRLNVSFRDEDALLAPYDMEATRRLAREFLKRPNPPTAIFAATDLQGVSILRAARDLGMQVPGDLAILGFDNIDLADHVGLTTVNQHLDESGRVAVELLISRMADPSRPVQHIQLPLEVVERETV
jgi:DNA-binding LacI/PurR family transcriptional regulator